jgi:hypothetical protein
VNVTTETATVFRGGGRRYFTKRAAYIAEARARIRARWLKRFGCDCPWSGDEPPFDECAAHGQHDRVNRLAVRLAKRLQRQDRP